MSQAAALKIWFHKTVRFGVGLGQARWATGRPLGQMVDQFFAAATHAENTGFDSLWVGDHIVFPENIDYTRSHYPMTPSGRLGISTDATLLDALTLLASLTRPTSRIRLGVSVLVLPYRHPLLSAKMLATIDVLSSGRLLLGIGVGWLREEFEALGAASFEHRGTLSDEYVRVFREMWESATPHFEGRWYRYEGFGFEPKPVQAHVPIWVGGASPASIRRAARLGDAWHPSHVPPETYATLLPELQRHLDAASRPPEAVTLSVNINVALDQSAGGDQMRRIAPEDMSMSFVGSTTQLVRLLQQYEELGVEYVGLNLGMADGSDVRHAIDLVAQEVMPSLPPP